MPSSHAQPTPLSFHTLHTPHLVHVDLLQLLLSQCQRPVHRKVLRYLQVLWPDELQGGDAGGQHLVPLPVHGVLRKGTVVQLGQQVLLQTLQ